MDAEPTAEGASTAASPRDAAIRRTLAALFPHDEGVQYGWRDRDGGGGMVCTGLAQRHPPQRVVPRTSFHCFSTTKPITALALLQLVDEGRVSLDEPLTRYLPELPYRNGATVRQVLGHQAGLANPPPLTWVHRAEQHAAFDHGAFLARVLQEHPEQRAAGQRARYSNIGFLLIGRLIEVLTGERYTDRVRTRILEVVRDPAATDAWLDFTTPDTGHATGYTRRWSPIGLMVALMPDPPHLRTREGGWLRYDPFYLDGAAYGGLVGNVRGWSPLLTAIVGRDPRLLSAQGFRSYFEPQPLADGRPTGHALSWFTGSVGGHDYRCHAGGGPGYGAEIRVYPELGASSVLVCNTTIVNDRRMLDRIDAAWLPARP